MLRSRTVLIVDESGYAALDLAQAIEESDGSVAGPVASLSEALVILDSRKVQGAVVDSEVVDANEIVMLLVEREVPMVIQASGPLSRSLGQTSTNGNVLVRPVEPRTVLECLLMEIGKSELRDPITLGSNLKQV
jgi:hypothetical protein